MRGLNFGNKGTGNGRMWGCGDVQMWKCGNVRMSCDRHFERSPPWRTK